MRTILIATVAAAAIATLGAGNAMAAPINGTAIRDAANAAAPTEQVHCRWYPHRHRNNVPHGWGRGCAHKDAPKVEPKRP